MPNKIRQSKLTSMLQVEIAADNIFASLSTSEKIVYLTTSEFHQDNPGGNWLKGKQEDAIRSRNT
jgi:hypothetical protein